MLVPLIAKDMNNHTITKELMKMYWILRAMLLLFECVHIVQHVPLTIHHMINMTSIFPQRMLSRTDTKSQQFNNWIDTRQKQRNELYTFSYDICMHQLKIQNRTKTSTCIDNYANKIQNSQNNKRYMFMYSR